MSQFTVKGWHNTGRERPPFAVEPGPGQESVWDYPRPPVIVPVTERVRIEYGGIVLADTVQALRVLETASPPTVYLPPQDIRMDWLEPANGSSYCEWKGRAQYWTVRVGDQIAVRAAWSYPQPNSAFNAIRDYMAFYAGKMDACFVGEMRVKPQAGDFYGGWMTPNIVGPCKGEPGTSGW
ncbi:MAG: DUF427 domain-containing protein [Anaerolineae bacterium]|nr:DUF427 domain-containing protein [Anaerolineae bacterium]